MEHDLLSYTALRNATQIPGTDLYRPSLKQGLGQIPDLVSRFIEGRSHCVILSLDGIGADISDRGLNPDKTVTLTSTYPSTSTSAWLTAATGLSPAVHEVCGVVYAQSPDEALYNSVFDYPHRTSLGAWPTIFSTLRVQKWNTLAFIGDLNLYPGSWRDAILRDAAEIVLPASLSSQDLYTKISGELQQVLGVARHRRVESKLMIWCFLNFDDHLHCHGPDSIALSCVALVQDFAEQASLIGWPVACYSDHGLTKACSDQSKLLNLEVLQRDLSASCRFGGAGRSSWAYIKPGTEGATYEALNSFYGATALVLRKDEALKLGIIERDNYVFGDILCLAASPNFPCGGPPFPFNHGSLTRDEMFVNFNVWHER